MNLDVLKKLKTVLCLFSVLAATRNLEERRPVTMELKMRPLQVNKGKTTTTKNIKLYKKNIAQVNAVYD